DLQHLARLGRRHALGEIARVGLENKRHQISLIGLRDRSREQLVARRHCAPRCVYAKYCPPLAVSVEPVISPASSEARNTTQRAISSGSPRRPIGISGRIDFSKTSFGTACTISVLM